MLCASSRARLEPMDFPCCMSWMSWSPPCDDGFTETSFCRNQCTNLLCHGERKVPDLLSRMNCLLTFGDVLGVNAQVFASVFAYFVDC